MFKSCRECFSSWSQYLRSVRPLGKLARENAALLDGAVEKDPSSPGTARGTGMGRRNVRRNGWGRNPA